MNEAQRSEALTNIEKYLETCQTKDEVDRAISMLIEVESRYADYLLEIIEEVAPDYIPMELQ